MAFSHVADLPLVSPIGVGGLCPSVGTSIGLTAAIQLGASLTGAVALNAQFSATPPTLAFYLGSAVSGLIYMGETLSAGATLGVPDCSWGADVSAGLSVTATIEASLNTALSTGLPNLSALLSAGIGVYAFTYTGPASGLGAALTTELASSWPDGVPSSGACDAMIFVAPTAVAAVLLALLDGLGTPPPGLAFVAKLSSLAELSLSTATAMPQASAALNAQLSACAGINASLTPQIDVPLPTLAVQAAAVADVALPNLRAAIEAGAQAPSVQVVLDATASLAADITTNFGAMASLGIILGRFDALFGIYTYSGTGTAFGAAVTAGLTDPSDVTAVVLATTSPADFAILQGFFGGAA